MEAGLAAVKIVIGRVQIAPFECALAVLLILSGLATVLHWGPMQPFDALLPSWEVYLLSAVFIVSGAALVWGISATNVAVESVGLVLLCAVLVCRLILYGVYLGLDATFLLTGALDTVFILAALLRMLTIRQVRVVIDVRKDRLG